MRGRIKAASLLVTFLLFGGRQPQVWAAEGDSPESEPTGESLPAPGEGGEDGDGLDALFLPGGSTRPETLPAPKRAPELDDLFISGPRTALSATRFPAPRRDIASTLTVLTREELDAFGYHTPAEALRHVPGLFLEADERRLRLVSRGLPDSMLMVFDGVPLISDAARLVIPLEDELSLDKIARMEIVRGPGSATWGRNAFGGVVNLIPLRGAEIGGARATAEIGAFETLNLSLVAGERFGPLDLAGSASWRSTLEPKVLYEDTPTFYVFPTPQIRIPAGLRDLTGRNARDEALELWARGSVAGFSLGARFVDFVDYGQLASFSHAVLAREDNEHRGGRGVLTYASYVRNLGPRFDLTALTYFNFLRVSELERLFPAAAPTPFGGAVEYAGNTGTLGFHLLGDWRATDWLGFNAGVQLDLTRSDLEASFTDPADDTVTGSATREAESAAGSTWLMAVLKPPKARGLSLHAGVGIDIHSDFATAVNPRFALVYSPGGGFGLRLHYGEADRTPDQFDLISIAGASFASGGLGGVAPNPNLRPERLRTGEISVELKRPGLLLARITGFINHHRLRVVRILDTSDPTTPPELTPINLGSRLVGGMELEGRLEMLGGKLRLQAAYALVSGWDENAVDGAAGTSRALDAPTHTWFGGVVVRPWKTVTLALDILGVGARELRDGSGERLPAEVTFGAHATVRLPAAHMAIELRAVNLTDARTFSRNEGVPNRSLSTPLPGAPFGLFLSIRGEL